MTARTFSTRADFDLSQLTQQPRQNFRVGFRRVEFGLVRIVQDFEPAPHWLQTNLGVKSLHSKPRSGVPNVMRLLWLSTMS